MLGESERTMKKIIWIIILVSILVLGLALWMIVSEIQIYHTEHPNDRYMKTDDYYAALGLPWPCVYQGALDCYGNPKEIKDYYTSYGKMVGYVLCYDGVELLFVDQDIVFCKRDEIGDDPSDFLCVEMVITSNAFEFGRHRIRIGSTKNQVKWAYRHNGAVFGHIEKGTGYVDGYWSAVRFLYDENNRVVKITFDLDCLG